MNDFYVYGLYRPGEEIPFYVGKGRERRVFRSSKEYGSIGNPHKLNIIRKLQKEGKEPISKIIFDNLTESESFKKEMELIEFYGRKDFGGVLCNMSDGGEGFANRVVTEETRQRMSESHFGRVHSEETKSLMSKNHSGKNNPMYGRSGDKSPTSKPIIVDDVEYNSITIASQHINLHRTTIGKRVRDNDFPNYYYK